MFQIEKEINVFVRTIFHTFYKHLNVDAFMRTSLTFRIIKFRWGKGEVILDTYCSWSSTWSLSNPMKIVPKLPGLRFVWLFLSSVFLDWRKLLNGKLS